MITLIDEAINIPIIRLDILRKFESKLEILDKPPNPLVKIDSACILCSGHSIAEGYKLFCVSNKYLDYKIRTKTHIASYLLYNGPRGGKQVQHLCGVRYCANPQHLTLGNPKQNGEHASITRAKTDHSKKSWKLSQPDKQKIMELFWIHDYSKKELAEMYKVDYSTIHRITN